MIIYGGVFPTYHWRDVLRECPEVDFIVRGEGERATLAPAECIVGGGDCRRIAGLAWHHPPTDRRELGAILGEASPGRRRDPEKTGTARAAA